MRHLRNLTLLAVLLLLCAAGTPAARAQSLDVLSPDGAIRLTFTLESSAPTYRIQRFDRDVILPSQLGFVFKEGGSLAANLTVASSARSAFDETWTQPWGEKKDIRNHYNELRIDLEEISTRPRRMTIVFRVFDDGVGFRYELPAQENLGAFKIMDELTEFALAGDYTAWWIPAFEPNRYEYLYTRSRVGSIKTVHTPLTMEAGDGLYLSIHEAALTDWASMTLENRGKNRLKAVLVPWSDGVLVRGTTPHRSPWRTIQIAGDAGALITSYLILNLDEPNKLGDVSWVKPGKYVGIWWAMHLGISTWSAGPRHGATTEHVKRYIDFAARHGFDRVLVEGWNVGWNADWTSKENNFNFTTPYPDFDIAEIARYGAERGVSLIGHHETGGDVTNYERQMKTAFDFDNRYGITTVKTGYVRWGQGISRVDENGIVRKEWHHGQYMVRHYRAVVEEAARHHIMLDVHEPIKDTGIRRTFPNMMTREGARGQEYNAWSGDGGNPPEHETILPFTRLLAGPMDFTPGIFDLLFEEARPANRVNTTLAKQLALYVVIYSPLQMAADLPANYDNNPAPFKFIEDVPADWSDTKVLHAKIGDFVTTVRRDRGSDNWYLGSVTDENGRTLEAPLGFLEPNTKYVAEIYRDAADADWEENPLAIEITRAIVDSGTVLKLVLAPGGGQAIRFRPAGTEDLQSVPPYKIQ
jgi:alpha-glucosidase